MSDAWDETPKVDLGHPDSSIRLASPVHRFRVPKMNQDRKVSFARSFHTTGQYEKTRKVMLKVGMKNTMFRLGLSRIQLLCEGFSQTNIFPLLCF